MPSYNLKILNPPLPNNYVVVISTIIRDITSHNLCVYTCKKYSYVLLYACINQPTGLHTEKPPLTLIAFIQYNKKGYNTATKLFVAKLYIIYIAYIL